MCPEEDIRILHVIAPGPMAGAEKSALSSIRALKDAGYAVEAAVIKETRKPSCADDFTGVAREMGLRTAVFETNRRFDTSLSLKLRARVRGGRINVVHSHGYKSLLHLAVFRDEISALISTYHGATSHTLAVCLYECIDRILCRKLDCLFAVSEGTRRRLESGGALPCRVAVIPNMLSERMAVKPREDAARKTSFDLLFLGRLSSEKGADVLIEAMSLLAHAGVRLHVVGDGPKRPVLEERARALGISEKVEFHGFKTDIKPHLGRADILVMPSRTEGLPMTLIEAASAGIPVIASRVGGIPEVVTHGETAILVDPGDPKAICRAVNSMTGDFQRFHENCVAKAKEIADRHSPERWVASAVYEYRRALGLC